MQQEMSLMKDLVVQMHSTSMPQLEGMALVAQSRFDLVSSRSCGLVQFTLSRLIGYIPRNRADRPDLEQQPLTAELSGSKQLGRTSLWSSGSREIERGG